MGVPFRLVKLVALCIEMLCIGMVLRDLLLGCALSSVPAEELVIVPVDLVAQLIERLHLPVQLGKVFKRPAYILGSNVID